MSRHGDRHIGSPDLLVLQSQSAFAVTDPTSGIDSHAGLLQAECTLSSSRIINGRLDYYPRGTLAIGLFMRLLSLPNQRAEALQGDFARRPVLDGASGHRDLHGVRRRAPDRASFPPPERWLSATLLLLPKV